MHRRRSFCVRARRHTVRRTPRLRVPPSRQAWFARSPRSRDRSRRCGRCDKGCRSAIRCRCACRAMSPGPRRRWRQDARRPRRLHRDWRACAPMSRQVAACTRSPLGRADSRDRSHSHGRWSRAGRSTHGRRSLRSDRPCPQRMPLGECSRSHRRGQLQRQERVGGIVRRGTIRAIVQERMPLSV